MWLFLTVPVFPTAKEAVWEDKGVSAADSGFCERVEGNEGQRASVGVVPHTVRKLLKRPWTGQ